MEGGGDDSTEIINFSTTNFKILKLAKNTLKQENMKREKNPKQSSPKDVTFLIDQNVEDQQCSLFNPLLYPTICVSKSLQQK